MLPKLSFQNQVNAVGGVAVLVVGGYMFFDLTRSRQATPCSTRYPSVTQMALQKANGAPFLPAEFQARVGYGERGIVEKTSVRAADGAPAKYVLDVTLGGPRDAVTGAGFQWAPNGMGKACWAE